MIIRFPIERTRQPVELDNIKLLSDEQLQEYIKWLEKHFPDDYCDARR